MKEETSKKEVEECTFTPDTQATAQTYGVSESRTLDQFLEDQKKFLEDKEMHINMRLEEESKHVTGVVHQPTIDENSRRMIESKGQSNEPVYDRLYKLSKEQNQKHIHKVISAHQNEEEKGGVLVSKVSLDLDQNTYAPKINPKSQAIQRDKPVQDLLYEDAMRRKEV